jgi:anaerobic magnesium-protoporphyrin IX monomethyl ester cyclase
MKVALIYPPTCDPTAPYLALPTLTAPLRMHGVEVLPIDANIEVYDRLLRQASLRRISQQLERRLARLERNGTLNHVEQLAYSTLWQAKEDAQSVPGAIADAVAVLRDRSGIRFFDPLQYETAITTVENALRLISAAFTPLALDFKS